jgi:nucleotide-binding universal stress UspA family protein
MSKNILLAVDTAAHDPALHVVAAADMTRELAHDSGDHVIVLHVHEFAVGRWPPRMAAPTGREAKRGGRVDRRAAGSTEGEITDANTCHFAATILAAAKHHDARLVVLGSSSRTDLPRMPLGSVAARLLNMATRPVLIVPRPDTAS